MERANRRKTTVRTFQAHDNHVRSRDAGVALIEHRHVDGIGIHPQPEQAEMAGSQIAAYAAPSVPTDNDARAAMMLRHAASFDHVDERRHRYPNSLATLWKEATTAGGR